ncbi:3-phenylpropionate/trans-cinnamate dioxygenase ferredoxin reductase subunit [Pseudonocardia ammonioxydans]|uniref:3-phenylpropionate/trans-cinnamate dioxygenase ferredoxin reductase subunit n=1 Tax=Pseudonocardia ammonioxydans TaxID=260086 RepID=A0A1I5FW57_PSUAM|nr:FAD-dependent oxidoreductase [Pseudonocardia ammonioxydans]SFO28007.1 3-phenylpropionate/trans-cinnamate dioxygenase ferredoxin reductase subunit [Pseudonocardia ammonioxydans]
MSTGTLIVGASQAGAQLAASLREAGDTAPIALVGHEAHLPYQRPPLSKGYLLGKTDATGLALRSAAYYAERGIEVLTGERVVELAVDRAATARGRTLVFDRLALTVGARVRRLAVPGAELHGVHHLRVVADSDRLRAALPFARRVVVVGGGFVGLEAAAAAGTFGAEVTVVEAADRLLGRAVSPLTSEFYLRAHRRRGVRVLLGSAVTAIAGTGGEVSGVVLADGTELPADLVLVGVGVVPRTELAEQLGLLCSGGIVVDPDARTSIPTVVAAGDCTVQPGPAGPIRIESVQNAVSQGKIAAATLAGCPRPAVEVPWFWSDQGDLKLQIAGISAGHDQTVLRGDPESERFAVLYYRAGALVAVDAVNSPADYLVGRKALAQGLTVPADQAGAADRPLKELLVAAP